MFFRPENRRPDLIRGRHPECRAGRAPAVAAAPGQAASPWLFLALLTLAGVAGGDQADPLRSSAWPGVQKNLGIATLTFDRRVEVLVPEVAEDSLNVPVTVNVHLPAVRRVLVVADFNPIVTALEFEPLRALPHLTFRLKLQQASPLRALVQTTDGAWFAGGRWVDAAGGGCTAPSLGRSQNNWADTLGQVELRGFARGAGERLKFRVMHPMDTGLAPGIPAFHLRRLELRDESGEAWARLAVHEPVSENPIFSLDFAAAPPALWLEGEDNNGNRMRARWRQ